MTLDQINQLLQTNDLICWLEPDDVILFVHAQDAVLLQNELAHRQGFIYPDNVTALLDFIVAHWAFDLTNNL